MSGRRIAGRTGGHVYAATGIWYSRQAMGLERRFRQRPRAATMRSARLGIAITAMLAVAMPARSQEAAAILYSTQSSLDRVAVYTLLTNGKISADPIQQLDISSPPSEDGANPRRLFLHPRGCALYVATANRIEAFRIIGESGRLERFANDEDSIGRTAFEKPGNYQYVVVHPDGLALYAAATALHQLQQFYLNPDGSIARVPTALDRNPPIASCVQGVTDTRFQGLGATTTHLYANIHSPASTVIFPLTSVGQILSAPKQPKPNGEDNDDDDDDNEAVVHEQCDPEDPSFGVSRSDPFIFPKALLLDDVQDTVYISDPFRGRIYACPIAADGTLPDCPNKDKDPNNDIDRPVLRTKPGAFYEQLALSDSGVLFTSVFSEGRLRAFTPNLEKELLVRKKTKVSDLFSTPGGIDIGKGFRKDADGPTFDILYVAQGDLNRITGFRIDASGFQDTTAHTETTQISGSFPNDVAILPLPLDPSACAALPTTSSSTTVSSTTTSSSTVSSTTVSTTTTTTIL